LAGGASRCLRQRAPRLVLRSLRRLSSFNPGLPFGGLSQHRSRSTMTTKLRPNAHPAAKHLEGAGPGAERITPYIETKSQLPGNETPTRLAQPVPSDDQDGPRITLRRRDASLCETFSRSSGNETAVRLTPTPPDHEDRPDTVPPRDASLPATFSRLSGNETPVRLTQLMPAIMRTGRRSCHHRGMRHCTRRFSRSSGSETLMRLAARMGPLRGGRLLCRCVRRNIEPSAIH
jgi:hypothetical protein